MGLEEYLFGSKTIRDFLRHFSEQQWDRVTKATFMLGIEYLQNVTGNDIRRLAAKDIEDMVIDLSVQQVLKQAPDAKAIIKAL
jgi:hypothetical protein